MRAPDLVTSPANPLLKDIRKALASGSLTDFGMMVAETFHVFDEALRSEARIRTVVSAESVRTAVEERLAGWEHVRMVVVPDRLIDAASQGVVALVEPREWSVEDLLSGTALIVVLDGVQDPGNLGTILRSAEAFGASGVMMLKGTVNPFNSKAVRASAGSVFRVPFVNGVEAEDALSMLKDVAVYAAMPGAGAQPATTMDFTRPCALVIGSEGQGVGEAMRGSSMAITIPTTGVESLNAAISAAILLYEARRQRMRP